VNLEAGVAGPAAAVPIAGAMSNSAPPPTPRSQGTDSATPPRSSGAARLLRELCDVLDAALAAAGPPLEAAHAPVVSPSVAAMAEPELAHCEAGAGDRPLSLAVSPDQAAELLGISRDAFDRHVLPHITYRRVGRRVLIPLTELERWLERNGRAAS
jgi:excisionase family DNA binding protein